MTVTLNRIHAIISPMDNFASWLNSKIEQRGWSFREVARRAGLSPTIVADVASGRANPGPDFLDGIARAFNLTRREVFARAGLIEPDPPITSTIKEMQAEYATLSEDDQQAVLRMVKALNAARNNHEPKGAETPS